MKELEKELGTEGLLSVIVPVYNVEKYLPKCLESLVNQTYPNMEIILVDDGSTDKSGRICEEYAKKYRQIRVIHKENGGVQQARNTGLRNAKGDYIALVDADDFLDLDMYEILMRNLKHYGCDLSAGLYQLEYSLKARFKTRNGQIPGAQIFRGKDNVVRSLLAPRKENSIQGFIWNKIYKKDCIENIYFKDEVKITDDVMFSWDVIWGKGVESACLVDAPLYHYMIQGSSLTRTASPEKCRSAQIPFEIILADIQGTELEKDCIASALRNYLSWNITMCNGALDNRLEGHKYYALARSNIQKYKEYIRVLPHLWTRIAARLILHSRILYAFYHKFVNVAKKIRAVIKSRI